MFCREVGRIYERIAAFTFPCTRACLRADGEESGAEKWIRKEDK